MRQSARLDRKKFWKDPVMIITIFVLTVFLALFILYPLAMLLLDSVYVKDVEYYYVGSFMKGEKITWYLEDGTEADETDKQDAWVMLGEGDSQKLVPVYYADYFLFPKHMSVADAAALTPDSAEQPCIRVLNNQNKYDMISLYHVDDPYHLEDEEAKKAVVPYLYNEKDRIQKMNKVPSADTARVKLSAYHVSLDAFPRIFDDPTFNKAFFNTLKLGFCVGLISVVVGLLFAYVDCYVKVRFKPMKKLFDVVSLLPVVSPPFVLSLSMILLFGRSGIVTREMLGIYDSDVYGFWGILIVQGMTFFPVCYLMLKGLLNNIDCSMEEAARDMGAGRFRVFLNVTLPLMLPGLGNAFLVTFIESVADFANPMLIGGDYDTLATTIYLRITGGTYDTNGAAAMAAVLLGLTLILFFVQKYWLEKKTASTLTGKASRARMPIEDAGVRIPLSVICTAVSAFVVLLYIAVPFGSLFKLWGKDYSLSIKWYEYIFEQDGLRAFKDSFILSLISAPVTALLSMIISYLVVKKKFKLKGFIEVVSMLAMAVPGTVLGVGFIRGFANGVFRTGFMQSFYGSGAILVVVFVVRSLPVGTRSGISALRQIDKSIEESAYDMGAGSGKVFTTVTLPLIKESFFSGLVTTFVRSITAISAIILLVTPEFLLITCRINEFAEKGSYGVACAYATILIGITYGAILLMNWLLRMLGTSKEQRRSIRQNNYYRKMREKANRHEAGMTKYARKEKLAIELNTLDDEYRTNLAAATELRDQQTDLAAGDREEKKRIAAQFREEKKQLRLIRDQKAAAIRTSGSDTLSNEQ